MNGNSPAHLLEGLTLRNGWKVGQRRARPAGATGAKYSVCYLVERNGEQAFLKALDYARVNEMPGDLPANLYALTQAFLYERSVLDRCKERGMNRVVRAIDSGSVRVDSGILGEVNYLIFERADGDVRQRDSEEQFDAAVKLRVLHNIAVGLSQLHRGEVNHNDLKPSNVLSFGDFGFKLGDLGSSTCRSIEGPNDRERISGTKAYAPLELRYSQKSPHESPFASDLYLLGSMIMFFFAGITMSASIVSHIDAQHSPQQWTGRFEDVLPYIREAFGRSMQDLRDAVQPRQLAEPITRVCSELCDPEPSRRGHPLNRRGISNPYSLERYITEFSVLLRKLELGLLDTINAE